MILTIRTDAPDAEVSLFEPSGDALSHYRWHADRQLAKELLGVIRDQLVAQKAEWSTLTGIIVYQGPGSFTGLRIGITVANTLAYSLKIPIVGAQGDAWLSGGIERIIKGAEDDRIVLPFYGAEAHITLPRK